MDIFLVRHGETNENAQDIIQGWLNTNLNDNGRQQAKNVATRFNEHIEAIYSSDLARAVQTADEFRKKYPNIPYFEDDRLRERNFGDATGSRRSDYDWDAFWTQASTHEDMHVETLDDYTKRVQSFLTTLIQSDYERVLVVTHSGTINRLQYLADKDHKHTDLQNADIIHLQFRR